MAEKDIGGVQWVVDADTSPAINSTKQLDVQVNKVERTLTGLDTKVSKTAKSVNAGMGSLGRTAGQAGIQIQQLVGQIQGGQSAMLALSQQGADLGFVLGVPLLGAIVGIGASIAGMLLPNLADSTTATEKLEEALEQLDKIVITNSDGVSALSNEYAELAKKSKELAQAQLLLARVNADKVLNESAEAARDALLEFDTFFNAVKQSATGGVFDILDDTLKRTDKTVIDLLENTDLYATGLTQLKSAVEQVNDEFGTTTDESVRILRQFAKFREAGTVENFNNLASAMLNIADTSRGKVTPEFVALVSQVTSLAFQSKTAAEQAEFLDKALAGLNVTTESSVKNAENLTKARESLSKRLTDEVAMLGMTERGMALYRAEQLGATQEMIDQINTIYDHKDALKAQEEAIKKTAAAQKQAMREDQQNADDMKRMRQQAAREEERARLQRAQQGVSFATGIVDRGLSAAEQMQAENERLKELYAQGLIDKELFTSAMTQLDKERAQSQEAALNMSLAAFSSSFDAIAQVLKTSEGEQSNAFKAMFALSKGFAIAQAGLNLAKAISDAMAWGGLTPIEKFAAAATVGSAATGVLTQIMGASYAGREHGGPMMANVPYEVGEKNKPELLMIPGNNGKMFSNAEVKSMMNGGGGGVTLNQQIITPPGYTARTSGDGVDQLQVVEIVKAEMSNANSGSRRALTSNTNLQSQIKGGR
ncbi:hypothetical protein [Vibrio phage LP.1]|nr:hypothetical protein [Vibrio phage LP.1]